VSIEVNLPPAVAKATPNPPKPIYISIKQSGEIFIGDFPTSVDEMGQDLAKNIGKRDPAHERVFIRADEKVRYGAFMEVMNTLQDNGFYSVALVGRDDS
jgi:biopolymer transport protein ExbD/biopolymer transport protein TolR